MAEVWRPADDRSTVELAASQKHPVRKETEGVTVFLLPLREKVAAKPTDEGSRRLIRLSVCRKHERPARPLIRPPSEATFSRKGRRI